MSEWLGDMTFEEREEDLSYELEQYYKFFDVHPLIARKFLGYALLKVERIIKARAKDIKKKHCDCK